MVRATIKIFPGSAVLLMQSGLPDQLFATAFDERIALSLPHQAGFSGSVPSLALFANSKPLDTLDTPQTAVPGFGSIPLGQFEVLRPAASAV